jgi:hypothetical protein
VSNYFGLRLQLTYFDRRGGSAVCTTRSQFVVDNGTDGFDLHHLDTGAFIRTLGTGQLTRRVPKQVAFTEESGLVVGGSDHGAVYLWDRRTGIRSGVLRHADRGLVQTIAVSTLS